MEVIWPVLRYLNQYRPRCRYRLYLLRGRQRDTGTRLTILATSPKSFMDYLADTTFRDSYEETQLGRVCSWTLRRRARELDVDVLVVGRMPRFPFRRCNGKRFLLTETWFGGEVDFETAFKRIRASSQIKRYLQTIRKHSIQYEFTREPDRIEDFYYNMHVPYMKRRYPKTYEILAFEGLAESMDNLELALVRQGDTYLAGHLLKHSKNGVCFWKAGLKDGDPAHLKTGCSAALYYNDIVHMSNRGFTKLDLGFSRPHLHDGLLQHKKLWGMRLVDDYGLGILVAAMNDRPETKAFFENTPLVCVCRNKLVGTVFARTDSLQSSKDLTKLHKKFYCGGMDRLRVLTLGDPRGVPTVPDQLKRELIVEPATGFFESP